MSRGRRIGGLDALRGLCVILMVLFHLAYDLVFYCNFPGWLVDGPWSSAIQVVASWGFILLAGVSSCLSKSNVKRGLLVLLIGVGVSVVTWYWGDFVRFGILQFLGCAMVVYGLSYRAWNAIPALLALPIYAVALYFGLKYLPMVVEVPHLYPFGFITTGFRSADYFPFLPWFFLFLIGTKVGTLMRGRWPKWFSGVHLPPLNYLGRHALVIYVVHQPVLLGLSWVLAVLLGYSLPF